MIRPVVLWVARHLGVSQPDQPSLWLKRLFWLPHADELTELAHSEIRSRLDPLDWLAEKLGVVDKRSVWQWLLYLFVFPSGHAARTETSFWRTFLTLSVDTIGLLFLTVEWIVLAGVRALSWLWQRLLSFLPAVNHEAVGRRLEGWLETPSFRKPWLLWLLVLFSTFFFWLVVTTPFTWFGQFLFLVCLWGAALFVRRIPGNLPALILIALSVLASCRYGWWRLTQTIPLDSGWETFLAIGLLLAEIYTWLVLLLGYIQNAWPLKRHTLSLPLDTSLWPSVDVFIPTYNEPLKVLEPTVLAAKGIDWPSDKLNIYILDDGRRDEFRRFAKEAGVGYIIRPDNAHSKAGNLNHALKLTHGEYVAIFDCDHLPTNSFLRSTMGWFFKDKRCAMLQTPHHFFSPDTFERNLGTFRRVPNEGALFYGLIQDGNDFWNATFFCGSCAVLRRGPLEEVGGVAVETVTEDAHTALKLHRLGYTTAYINIPLAAGLATESLSSHIGQRIRWARGMAQIFRIDNPFLGKGLSFFQRICYSNAMLHFFYGIPRLIFLTAPLTYLYFEVHIISAAAAMLALYVLPHMLQANLANAHIQGSHRHSFWAEVYESVLAWYIILPTAVAIFNPKAGKFNVTAKGGLIEHSFFDWAISKPYIVLAVLNIVGLTIGLGRLFFWNTFEMGTVLLNLTWTIYNLLILGAAIGVATEARQVRVSHRVSANLLVALHFTDGSTKMCRTEDYSMTGLGLLLDRELALPVKERVWVSLWHGEVEFAFPARVIASHGKKLGVQFDNLSIEQEANLVRCTFARADAWSNWSDEQGADRPLQSFKEIAIFGFKGYRSLWRNLGKGLARQRQSVQGWLGRQMI
ncbi:UDP-forming cellulose synthase catalytic subunit [Candidatus Nitrotoga sp. AM1P]|uniref:UDP-forming cellulose synthase catalytic subunit n=1 Tax=Candidatus Nitrotoga sp. AM1P TaxID=2559597 RepID=UPI0010BB7AB0|nr:UDP-forming cellulose synthase catalytic subunit [Candidatus Nitrotoga sp. AM1P]BBJ22958.1 cellulose synthase catalytic subunit [Candidatus Nitrotoga sp. AM1P]